VGKEDSASLGSYSNPEGQSRETEINGWREGDRGKGIWLN
jgi:hypothetical protein